jgi:4-hydroxy-tetrahydrodipicolinate synthase
MKPNWIGVYPALLTPFQADGSLDIPLFELNLTAQIDAGVKGVIIGGSLGEASTLVAEEKKVMIEVAKRFCSGRLPVILNIAASSTQEAIEQAAFAEQWGADGLMLHDL